MDSTGITALLGLIILCLLGNGFFALLETSLLESHKSRLEKMVQAKEKDAQAALELLDRPEESQSVVQIGLTLMSVLTGVFCGILALGVTEMLKLPHANTLALAVCVIISAYLLLLGEFLPKAVALENPEKVLLQHHRTLLLFIWISKPFVSFLTKSAKGILLLLGVNPDAEDTVTEEVVKDLIEQGTEDGTFEKSEQAMVDRIFRMGDQTAYALMTPRTQLLWLDLAHSLKSNLNLIHDHPRAVFPVGRDSLDNFCGILYAKDILLAAIEGKEPEIAPYIKKPLTVPRSMEIFRLLEKFRDSELNEAVVLDEYGGVVGFITLDHIMQEIIGDLKHKHSAAIISQDDDTWLMDGLYPIDEFKRRFGIPELPNEETDHFQTMAGFLTAYFGYIPKEGESCSWQDFTFTIQAMDRARIDKISVQAQAPGA